MENTGEMAKSNKRKLSLSLYLNYLVHGMGLIILTQNMQSLGKFWNVPIATVSYVISGIGVGRLLAYFIFGYLSDRFGRKQLVLTGTISYVFFFVGIPFTHSIAVAYLFAIIAGIANSALDSGTYPTFVEMGGSSSASNVFIKAFMSIGEFILPLAVALVDAKQMWFGWSFMIAVVVLVINIPLLISTKFPDHTVVDEQLADQEPASRSQRIITTVALAIFGYTTMAVMLTFTQWITMFAQTDLGYGALLAHGLLSLYSIGSITGVLVIFVLLKMKVSETRLLVVMNVVSLIALTIITNVSVIWISSVSAFVFGFTAAGGVLQIALNLLLKMFPKHKGIITGIYMTFGSVATFTVPLISGFISKTSIHGVMNFDILVGIVGTLLVVVTAITLDSGSLWGFLGHKATVSSENK